MNRDTKQKLLSYFLSIELIVILFFYLFGPQGLPILYRMVQDNKAIEHEIISLHTEVDALQESIDEWQAYPYYKEKIAREQLQMGHKNDKIYYIPR